MSESGLRAVDRLDWSQVEVCIAALQTNFNSSPPAKASNCIVMLFKRVFEKTKTGIPIFPEAIDANAACEAYGKLFTDYVRAFEPDLTDYVDLNGRLWAVDSEALRLVQWCDEEFAAENARALSDALYRAPNREHLEARMAEACPEIYNFLFPDAQVDAGHFDRSGGE